MTRCIAMSLIGLVKRSHMQDPIHGTIISFANFTVTLDQCHVSIMCKNSTRIRRKQFFIQYFCGVDQSYNSVLFYSIMNLTTFEKGISLFINEQNENTLFSYHTNTYYLIYKILQCCRKFEQR